MTLDKMEKMLNTCTYKCSRKNFGIFNKASSTSQKNFKEEITTGEKVYEIFGEKLTAKFPVIHLR